MTGSVRAELLVLRKRAATWILLAIWTLLGVFFAYVVPYALDPEDATGGLAQFLPRELPGTLLAGFPFFGGVFALMLGVFALGSDYGWDTLKTRLTQRPGRLHVLAAKLVALAIVLVPFVLALFAAGAVASLAIAGIENASVDWPSAWLLVRAMAGGWLILAVWAALGALLGTLTRGTSLAIGVGILYTLVIEGLVSALAESVARAPGRGPAARERLLDRSDAGRVGGRDRVERAGLLRRAARGDRAGARRARRVPRGVHRAHRRPVAAPRRRVAPLRCPCRRRRTRGAAPPCGAGVLGVAGASGAGAAGSGWAGACCVVSGAGVVVAGASPPWLGVPVSGSTVPSGVPPFSGVALVSGAGTGVVVVGTSPSPAALQRSVFLASSSWHSFSSFCFASAWAPSMNVRQTEAG